MRTLIVGDIHGCIDELLELVEAAGLRATDRLISVGDIVNKGPAPQEVFDYLFSRPHTTVLLGNHEARHMAGDRNGAAIIERIARAQFAPGRYRDFLVEIARLPLCIELPEAIVTHGYFEPGVPPTRQKREVLLGLDRGRQRLKEAGLWPWYEHYDHPKPIVVGHKAYRDDGRPLVRRGRVYAIDTKCCEGIALTGLVLPEFKLIRVRSRRNHWAAVQEAWEDFKPGRGGRFTLPPLPSRKPPRKPPRHSDRTPPPRPVNTATPSTDKTPGPRAGAPGSRWWVIEPLSAWWRSLFPGGD